MIANLEMDSDQLRRVIDSLHEPIKGGDSTSQVDVNMITKSNDNRMKLYVKQGNDIQILHSVSSGGDTSIDIEKNHKFVFTTKVLRDIVSKASSERLTVRFFEDKYAVRLENENAFSTPTSLDLHLVIQSEFEEQRTVSNLSEIVTLNRTALLESIETMGVVSNVGRIKINDDEMWISVSDQVEGEGKLMEYTHPDCELNDVEFKYRLDHLIRFLKNINAVDVTLSMNISGDLEVKASVEGVTSKFQLAPKI